MADRWLAKLIARLTDAMAANGRTARTCGSTERSAWAARASTPCPSSWTSRCRSCRVAGAGARRPHRQPRRAAAGMRQPRGRGRADAGDGAYVIAAYDAWGVDARRISSANGPSCSGTRPNSGSSRPEITSLGARCAGGATGARSSSARSSPGSSSTPTSAPSRTKGWWPSSWPAHRPRSTRPCGRDAQRAGGRRLVSAGDAAR